MISLMTADEVYDRAVNWAQQYDEALYRLLMADEAFAKGIFCIDRGVAKPRKDLAKWSEVKHFVAYF